MLIPLLTFSVPPKVFPEKLASRHVALNPGEIDEIDRVLRRQSGDRSGEQLGQGMIELEYSGATTRESDVFTVCSTKFQHATIRNDERTCPTDRGGDEGMGAVSYGESLGSSQSAGKGKVGRALREDLARSADVTCDRRCRVYGE